MTLKRATKKGNLVEPSVKLGFCEHLVFSFLVCLPSRDALSAKDAFWDIAPSTCVVVTKLGIIRNL